MYWNINGGNHWQDKALRVFCPSPHLCHLPTVQSKSFNHLSIWIFAIAHLTPPTCFSTTEHFFFMLRLPSSSDTNIFVLFTIMKRVLSSLQSPIRAWPIRRRVKHKKQTHYIRITSVLCYICIMLHHTHYIHITSVLCYISIMLHHAYFRIAYLLCFITPHGKHM